MRGAAPGSQLYRLQAQAACARSPCVSTIPTLGQAALGPPRTEVPATGDPDLGRVADVASQVRPDNLTPPVGGRGLIARIRPATLSCACQGGGAVASAGSNSGNSPINTNAGCPY